MTVPDPRAWHYRVDVMPRLTAHPAKPDTEPAATQFELAIPIRVHRALRQPAATVHWTSSPVTPVAAPPTADLPFGDQLAVHVDPGYWSTCLRDESEAPVVTPGCRLSARPYSLLLQPPFLPDGDSPGYTYLEAVIPALVAGSRLSYHITVTDGDEPVAQLGPYQLIVPPDTLRDQSPHDGDLTGGRAGTFTDPAPAWIARIRRRPPYVEVTVDLDDIDISSPDAGIPVRVKVGRKWYDADPEAVNSAATTAERRSVPVPGPLLPTVNVYTDSVTFTIPVQGSPKVTIEVYGRRIPEGHLTRTGTARILIAHFGIQALNDLFASPLAESTPGRPSYDPPRTYMQVTMRDEHGQYSSRPAVDASSTGDGYSYGFDVHRRFNVPYHLALNGPVLMMIAHDCADTTSRVGKQLHAGLDTIRDDISAGLLHPMIAGFGSFRWRWFHGGTLARDTNDCIRQQQAILYPPKPGSPDTQKPLILYPDSRIFIRTKDTLDALKDADAIKYLVLDSDTGYYGNQDSASLAPGFAARIDVGPNYLWHERRTGKRVLFIDDQLKDDIYSEQTPWQLGKPSRQVRQRLLHLALDPHRAGNILVPGDDYEKACNNGWFDGQGPLKERFSAFLEWISAHPAWISVLTVDDLEKETPVGEITVEASLEPTMDPGGAVSTDQNGHRYHLDTWIQTWADYPSLWRGGTLGHITRQVETALLSWPDQLHDELYDTAWLAFLTANQEQAWMKQPLEVGNPNKTPLGDPESFTISSALQIRNVLVWLKASVWAHWAAGQGRGDTTTHVNDGPLMDLIRQQAIPPDRGCPNPVLDPLHFDADPLPTYVLYNNRALVVLDANGAIASHGFILDVTADGARARTVSGTFKAYQFRLPDGQYCDGPVLQNTVWTPNHRYLGSEPDLISGPLTVDFLDLRTGAPGVDHTVMVNNFDAYDACANPAGDSVTFTYKRGGQIPNSLNQYQLADLLRQDGQARRRGDNDNRVLWHPHKTFKKTYRLHGTTLTISYAPDTAGRLIENEFCVDLYRQAMTADTTLNRVVSTDQRTITISNGTHAASVEIVTGASFTDPSMCTRLQDATDHSPPLSSDYLSLHRVLTDAVQLRSDRAPLCYRIHLDTPLPTT